MAKERTVADISERYQKDGTGKEGGGTTRISPDSQAEFVRPVTGLELRFVSGKIES